MKTMYACAKIRVVYAGLREEATIGNVDDKNDAVF